MTYHSSEKSWLLSRGTHTGITDNSDSETSSHTGKADTKTGSQLNESSVQRHLLLN